MMPFDQIASRHKLAVCLRAVERRLACSVTLSMIRQLRTTHRQSAVPFACSQAALPLRCKRTCRSYVHTRASVDTAPDPAKHSRSPARQPTHLARQPLEVYPWPQRRPEVFEWLEQAIQTAVQQLDKAPFLELIYPKGSIAECVVYSVQDSVVQLPQLWQGVAEHLSNSNPEVIMLVHQLAPEPDTNSSSHPEAWPSEDMFTGIAAHESLNQNRLKHCSMLLRNGIAEGILAGKVGDCCDGDVQAEVLPFNRLQHSQTSWESQQHDYRSNGQFNLDDGQLVDFWGVVVQSQYRSGAEGAYVLKTVRNANPVGCQCTHYSLMRISKGNDHKSRQAVSWLLSR